MASVRRLGCAGSLILLAAGVAAFYAVLAPWSLRIGDRWTPGSWRGTGTLRDSTGAHYGLYADFWPYFRGGTTRLGHAPFPHTALRGSAQVCTAGGRQYRFDLRGEIDGAWLHTNGAQMYLFLKEPAGSKIRRAFALAGVWHGRNLVLDDDKSMFMNFRPDGELTPSGGYTSPVPEKHATVTLRWGSRVDFESLCAGVLQHAGDR